MTVCKIILAIAIVLAFTPVLFSAEPLVKQETATPPGKQVAKTPSGKQETTATLVKQETATPMRRSVHPVKKCVCCLFPIKNRKSRLKTAPRLKQSI